MDPDISVCIVNFNGGDLLEAAVTSVLATAPPTAVEIIVVDNASTDASLDRVLARWPALQVIRNEKNVGFGRANNQAMQASKGRYFLLLNNDAVLQPGALSRMLDAADSHPRAAIVSCRVLNGEGNLQVTYGPLPSVWEYLPTTLRRRRLATQITNGGTLEIRRRAAQLYAERYGYLQSHRLPFASFLCGVCLLVKRAAVDEIGLLDERYFIYSEDQDWCARAHEHGWDLLYVADAVVHHAWQPIHNKPTSSTYLRSKRFSQGLYSRERCSSLVVALVGAGLVARSFVRYLRGMVTKSSAFRDAFVEFSAFAKGVAAAGSQPAVPFLCEHVDQLRTISGER